MSNSRVADVTNLYQTVLGRAPDPGGLSFYTTGPGSSKSLDAIRDDFYYAVSTGAERGPTAQSALDYYRATGDREATEKILELSAGMFPTAVTNNSLTVGGPSASGVETITLREGPVRVTPVRLGNNTLPTGTENITLSNPPRVTLDTTGLTPAQVEALQNMGPPSPTGQPTGGPTILKPPPKKDEFGPPIVNADLEKIFPGIDLNKLTPIQIAELLKVVKGERLSVDDLKRLFEGSSFDVNFVAPSGEARGDLDRLGSPGVSPYAPVDSFFGRKKGPNPVTDPITDPLAPVTEPVSVAPGGYSPGFSAVVPDFTQLPAFATRGFRRGGSVSKRELDSLPRYQAGGPVFLNRPLPSENQFMRDRLAEYETYNKAIEPYNRAVDEYQQQYGGYKSAYDKYMADVEAYNRAADAYNAGPRTEAFAMQQPSFSAQAPSFSAQAPARPSFSPEQFQEYQRQAMRRAGQRGTALEEAISRGIVSPEIARILGRDTA